MALRGTLTHRKTRRLARLLNTDEPTALGILEALWHVTAAKERDGGIGRMSNDDIIEEMFCRRDPDEVIDALTKAGWLDANETCRLYVHDWHEHSDDTTDNYIARGGMFYANGAQPRLKRLSEAERTKLCDRYGYLWDSVRTKSHKSAEPEPYPKPEPNPENKGERESAGEIFAGLGGWRPPTPGEVGEYLQQRGLSNPYDEGEAFVKHYGQFGWRIRGSLITNWKDTADRWEPKPPKGSSPPNSNRQESKLQQAARVFGKVEQ